MLSIEVKFDTRFFGSYIDFQNSDDYLRKILVIDLNFAEVLNASIYV